MIKKWFENLISVPINYLLIATATLNAAIIIMLLWWVFNSINQAKTTNNINFNFAQDASDIANKLSEQYSPLAKNVSQLNNLMEVNKLELQLLTIDQNRPTSSLKRLNSRLAIKSKYLQDFWPDTVDGAFKETLLQNIKTTISNNKEIAKNKNGQLNKETITTASNNIDKISKEIDEISYTIDQLILENEQSSTRSIANTKQQVKLLNNLLDNINAAMFFIFSIVIIILSSTLFFLFKLIDLRLNRLKNYAIDIENGRYDIPSPPKYSDVIGVLSSSIESMSKTLVSMLLKSDDLTQKAQQASKAKSDFLATMSHEIRTPINAIVGFTHLLQQSELKERQLSDVKRISTASESLSDLINDILDFSKIEAGELVLENQPFSINQQIEKCRSLFSQRAHEKQIDLLFNTSTELPVELKGDALRIYQVISNLLSNAIKFTSKGFVRVDVDWTTKENNIGELSVKVTDTGIGIKQANIELIFRSFSQEHSSTTREFGGTGLGLTISKQFIELMNGGFSVQSHLGKGSTFGFVIPVEMINSQPIIDVKSEGSAQNWMFIDSSIYNCKFAHDVLSSYNINVTSFRRYKDAISCLSKNTDWQKIVVELKPKDPLYNELLDTLDDNNLSITPITLVGDQVHIENLTLLSPIKKPLSSSELLGQLSNITQPNLSNESHPKDLLFEGSFCLIVDDNEINQILMSHLLENYAITFKTAINGQDALEKVNLHEFDLVFMDMMMPVMDGYQATDLIKKTFNKLPIIALTANATVDDQKKCFAAGADDFLAKPIDVDALENVLKKYLTKNA